MRKIFLLLLVLSSLLVSAAASAAQVTNAKWGVDKDGVLRFVVDMTELATYNVLIEDRALTLAVDAPLQDAVGHASKVNSVSASSMQVLPDGARTLVRVALSRNLAAGEYKVFTLKQDSQTNRPSRIVLDIMPPKASPAVAVGAAAGTVAAAGKPAAANSPAVGTAPAKPTVSNSPTAPAAHAAAPAAIASKPVVSNSPAAGASAPRPPAATGSPAASAPAPAVVSSGPVVSNSPRAASAPRPPAAATSAPAATAPGAPVISNKPIAAGASEQAQPAAPAAAKSAAVRKEVARSESGAQQNKAAATAKRTKSAKTDTKSKNARGSKNEASKKTPVVGSTGKYRTGGGIRGKIITLDAGHGGSDPGAIGGSGLKEKEITLAITKKVEDLLKKAGATVYMTRTGDVDVFGPRASDAEELQARVNVAEKHASDLFISIHINSSVNKNVSGFTSYYYPKSSNDLKIAKAIQNKLTANFGVDDMGVREANFYVVKRCTMPAALLELCFISNPKEEKLMRGNWFQTKAAKLIAEGIEDYFK